jgi:hypothetical protein
LDAPLKTGEERRGGKWLAIVWFEERKDVGNYMVGWNGMNGALTAHFFVDFELFCPAVLIVNVLASRVTADLECD